ncbi:hypothetical protein K9M74_01490 [Candidatus Woesearchaeota archaeon]|nr:hypothetical protein [Candidatus Woesearchaeota archaeon]
MGLFKKNASSRLYHMEIDDEGIDQQICTFIVDTEKKIVQFKEYLKNPSFNVSDADILNLRKNMTEIKENIIHLQNDILTISQLKLKNADFFIIKDDKFFSDKKQQLEKLNILVQKFITILEQHPSTNDLRNELINQMVIDLMEMQKTIVQILTDDTQLREIYKRIESL